MTADEIVRVLHVVPGDAVTALVRRGGELCVARYFAQPVRRTLDAAVAAHVLGGAPSPDVPPALTARLEGYRVRAMLGPLAAVPDVLAGGVRRLKLQGLAPLAAAFGNAYVITRAHAGSPLPEVAGQLGPDARVALVAAIARIVDDLHAGVVAHGALAPGSFAAAGASVTLVDLEPLRAADADRIAADRAAITTIAAWISGVTVADGTIAVPDDDTVFVPDE